jgi:hydrogenase-4 component E
VATVQAVRWQGVALAILPVALHAGQVHVGHIVVLSVGTLLVKAVVIPRLLLRSIRIANVKREVEPFISLHQSVLVAALLVALSFWLASALPLPTPSSGHLLVPVAFSTLFIGFLVLVSRTKAVTEVIGYLLLENGVFLFGQTVVVNTPYVVELGVFLDLVVAVFVMGIAIQHISREFDHIDTELLSTLRD